MNSQYMEYISFFFCGLALFGAFLNSNQSIKGFYVWLLSNSFAVVFDYHFGHWGYFFLHLGFLCTNINGIYTYKKEKKLG